MKSTAGHSQLPLDVLAAHDLELTYGGQEHGGNMSPACVSAGEWIGEGVRAVTYGAVAVGGALIVERRPHMSVKKGVMGAVLAGWAANTAESVARTGVKTWWFNHMCQK